MTKATRTISTINVLLGIWMIIAPILIYEPTKSMMVNAIVVGTLITLLSGFNLYRTIFESKEVVPKISFIVVILAVWLAISPLIFFSFGTTNVGMVYNPIVVGLLIIIPGIYNYFAGNNPGREELTDQKTMV